MKKFLLLSLGWMTFCQGIYSQFKPDPKELLGLLNQPLQSDRPGQALNAKTCGLLALQIQTGFHYEKFSVEDAFDRTDLLVPTTVRFGLLPKLELNSNFYYVDRTSDYIYNDTTELRTGFRNSEIGLRYSFMKGENWKPILAVQTNFILPRKNGDWENKSIGYSIYLVSSQRFDKFSINTNLGIKSHPQPIVDTGISFPYVLNFGFNLSQKLTCFVEGFGDLSGPSLYGDAGFAYTIGNYLQFDVFGGWLGETGPHPYWFVEAGITWRFSFIDAIAKKKMKEFGSRIWK